MPDVPVPAAAVRWPHSSAAVLAHAFPGACVCFHTDHFSFLNFNPTAIGSRAAARLSHLGVGLI